MKYRLGFVTNSSSTSYIIALKKDSSEMKLMDIMCENMAYYERDAEAYEKKSLEDIIEEYKEDLESEWLTDQEKDNIKAKMKDIKKLKDDGYDFRHVVFPNWSAYIDTLQDVCDVTKNVLIVSGEEW